MESSDGDACARVSSEVKERFPKLFGSKPINGKTLDLEQVIGAISNEIRQDLGAVLRERKELLELKTKAKEKYNFPDWDQSFQDPVTGESKSLRQIVQGLIDNFLGRDSQLSWRLNDVTPIPDDANPLKNHGLELTGPWHPIDMAIKQINADVAAMMGPDNEDAAPPDYIPFGDEQSGEIGLFVSRENERRLLAGEIKETEVVKKGEIRHYRINKNRESWPTSFHRVPGIHLRTPHITIDGQPAPSVVVDYVIHALNDYGSLKDDGSGIYYYQPKIQNAKEAFVIGKLVWTLERLMGAKVPGEFIKFKALYEEFNLGRFLPAVMWTWRYWLIGTNVGRWDYTGSLIEMWKDERVLPDPQNGGLMGMTSPHMMTYQRYNALANLMAGVKNEELVNAAPIGGMAAVMLYPPTDPYGRNRHNPVTLRAMVMDKLRERLIGLIFVSARPPTKELTLTEILQGHHEGRLYDTYRQSWVASPDKDYVRAGNIPLRTTLDQLQALLDSQEEWEMIDGKAVAPKISSGVTQDERKLLASLRLVNPKGEIMPWVISKDMFDSPESLFSKKLWGDNNLWEKLYDIPEGEVTMENIQHAFYMAANYGFQVLNGNLAAAIDDYKIIPNRVVRFMNDLATYRIFVGWLWSVINLNGAVTRDGYLKGPTLTQDGVIPSANSTKVVAGTRMTSNIFEELWDIHNQWTKAFFEDYDLQAARRVFVSCILDRRQVSGKEREQLIEQLIQILTLSRTTDYDSEKILDRIEALLGRQRLTDVERRTIESIPEVRDALTRAYGEWPSYSKLSTFENSAQTISRLFEAGYDNVLNEIRDAAPRFDRSWAPVVMDLLKRQLQSSKYIQHSARVLFVIASKNQEARKNILDAVYYVDGTGAPLFRNKLGEPSRQVLVDAVETGKVPRYALEAHDYVHDFA